VTLVSMMGDQVAPFLSDCRRPRRAADAPRIRVDASGRRFRLSRCMPSYIFRHMCDTGDQCHYTGVSRTIHNLRYQAKVWWSNLDDEVSNYIKSCFKCAFAKAPHSPSDSIGRSHLTLCTLCMST
jgi:hypothetical protein